MLVLTVLVSGGLKRSNAVNIFIVSITILSLVAFVVSGATSPSIGETPRSGLFDVQGLAHVELLEGTALMFVAYTGYGRVATLGEEIRNPSRNIPRAVVLTLFVSFVLYMAVAATALHVVGADLFASATSRDAASLELVAERFSHPWVSKLIAVGAVTAMAGVLLNLLLGLSRVLLAMARRRDMPTTFDFVNPENQSPSRAVWGVGAIIAILVLAGDVKTTWTFSAFTVLVYYGITNLAALCLPPEHRRFPRLISVAGLLGCFSLAAFIDPMVSAIGAGLLAVGFVLRLALGGGRSR